jgi:hypothetical protein
MIGRCVSIATMSCRCLALRSDCPHITRAFKEQALSGKTVYGYNKYIPVSSWRVINSPPISTATPCNILQLLQLLDVKRKNEHNRCHQHQTWAPELCLMLWGLVAFEEAY